MTHHHHKEEENYSNLYYIVGLLAGLFTGVILDGGITWVVVMGIFGVLFTAFFRAILVKGRGDA
jgi:membrane associated rhomboid family serine protease